MTAVVETRYGPMECLDGDSIVSRSLSLYGEWAQGELELVGELIRPGDVVLDVGAFLGTHTLALAAMVGRDGSVLSFEPRGSICEILKNNVRRNSLSQVEVYGYALGRQAGELLIEAVDTQAVENFGGLSLEEASPVANVPTEKIYLKTIDQLGLPRIDFIKIDAEGMEADVIAGAHVSLGAHGPLIFAECNDLDGGSQTWLSLTRLGYVLYGAILPAFNPLNWRGESKNIFGDGVEVSLVAVPAVRQNELLPWLRTHGMPLIDSVDDLALLLLHKPQYLYDTFASSPAAASLGVNFLTPLVRDLQEQLKQISEAHSHGLSRIIELEGSAALLGQRLNETNAERISLVEQNRILARYRRTSFLAAWERLQRIFR